MLLLRMSRFLFFFSRDADFDFGFDMFDPFPFADIFDLGPLGSTVKLLVYKIQKFGRLDRTFDSIHL
jgi:hypothetical protein